MKKKTLNLILLGCFTILISSCASGRKPQRPQKMKRSNWSRGRQAVDVKVPQSIYELNSTNKL